MMHEDSFLGPNRFSAVTSDQFSMGDSNDIVLCFAWDHYRASGKLMLAE